MGGGCPVLRSWALAGAGGRCYRLCYSFLFFSGLFVFGVFALDESQVLRLAVLLTGVVTLVAGLLNTYVPTSPQLLSVPYESVDHTVSNRCAPDFPVITYTNSFGETGTAAWAGIRYEVGDGSIESADVDPPVPAGVVTVSALSTGSRFRINGIKGITEDTNAARPTPVSPDRQEVPLRGKDL